MSSRNDPLYLLARQKIVRLSAELEVQLTEKRGGAPAIEIINRFRERAAESLFALVTVNLHDPAEVPKAIALQNEVKRYDEMFTAMRDIINEGIAEDRAMRESEREEMIDYLSDRGDGEQLAKELGLLDSAEVSPPD
jgi:hypothetical protein